MEKNHWLMLAVIAVYVAAETAGLAFAFRPAISFVRPAAGIALALVLIFGYRALPGILLGALIAQGLILQSLAKTLELGSIDVLSAAIGLSVTESIEAATALWMLRQVDCRRGLERVSDVVKFAIFAALVSSLIGATLGTLTMFLSGVIARDLVSTVWIVWWFGNAIAALAITPVLLTWKVRWLAKHQQWEAFCLSMLLLLSCQIAFGDWFTSNQTTFPLAFLPFPFVMWAALRFGGFGAAIASSFTTISAVFTVLRTDALLDWESAVQPALIQYVFSGVICVTALLIAASQSERRKAKKELQRREREFRSLLSAIPDALFVLDASGRFRQVFTADRDLIVDSPEKLIGKTIHEVLLEKDADICMQVIVKVIETGEPVDTSYPLTVDGVQRRFSARVVPYGTPPDPLVLWVARDITILHQTQRRLSADEALLRNLLELQEDERKLLSYELHDGFVQYMVGAHMSLEGVANALTPDQKSSLESLEWSRELIRKSIDEARGLISELRPLIIDESGIIESIGYLINDELGNDINVQFVPVTTNERLAPLLEGTVFRIVQELLGNVRKHSQAKNVKIRLEQNHRELLLTIEDDGIGFDLDDEAMCRFGVEQVTKRVDLFGGHSKIRSSPNRGTVVQIMLPLELPTDPQSDAVTLSPLRESPHDEFPSMTRINPKPLERDDNAIKRGRTPDQAENSGNDAVKNRRNVDEAISSNPNRPDGSSSNSEVQSK